MAFRTVALSLAATGLALLTASTGTAQDQTQWRPYVAPYPNNPTTDPTYQPNFAPQSQQRAAVTPRTFPQPRRPLHEPDQPPALGDPPLLTPRERQNIAEFGTAEPRPYVYDDVHYRGSSWYDNVRDSHPNSGNGFADPRPRAFPGYADIYLRPSQTAEYPAYFYPSRGQPYTQSMNWRSR